MNKYQEANVAGRWLWIAREFLIENGPMPEAEYLREVSRLLPGFLRDSRGVLIPRMSLAKQAVRRLASDGVLIQDGDMIRGLARYRHPAGLADRIRDLAARESGVMIDDIDHPCRGSVQNKLVQMTRGGELVRIGKGHYKAASLVRSDVDG